MPCGGQSVAAHAAVVFLFIRGLAITCETHDDVARADVGVVYHVAALHAAGHGRVHDDGAHQVAHVGRLAARGIDAHAHPAQFGQQLVRAVDDGGDDLARHQQLVAPDGAGHEDVIHRAHAKQVVNVHDQGVLRDAFPHAEVARLPPVEVGQRGLGARAVGVHDVAILRVSAQYVGDNLAESPREDALVDVLDGVVNVFFRCAYAAHHVSLVAHSGCEFSSL